MPPLRCSILALTLILISPAACAASPASAAAEDVQSRDAVQRASQELVTPETFDAQLLQIALFHATNATRVKHGRPALTYDVRLARAAQLHTERMIKLRFISHTDPHDPTLANPSDRARFMGIANPYLAENLATQATIDYRAGESVYPRPGRGHFSRTPDGPIIPARTYAQLADVLMQQWMDSPGHRKNILSADALQLGCGASITWQGDFPTVYAVQNFQLYERAK